MPVETLHTTITSRLPFLARSMSGVMIGWVESIIGLDRPHRASFLNAATDAPTA